MTFNTIWQQLFPSKPAFLEEHVGKQAGKVFIVTGANQGIGFELVKMLYPLGATVYLAGRSKERVENAITRIKSISTAPATPSTLKHLHLDLSDLTSIKASAAAFAAEETRLDILWNNAGVAGDPVGSTTKQGLESHVGTNCVGPLLFTQLLHPMLQAAVESVPGSSVRIVWTASLTVDTRAPTGGMDFESIDTGATTDTMRDYAVSKSGNWLLAAEAAKRWGKGKDGIVSVVLNPGNLYTNMTSRAPMLVRAIAKVLVYHPKFGAHTELYAGFTNDVGLENNGAYIWPFGIAKPNVREDIYQGIAAGRAKEFWEWCEKKYEPYV